MKLSLIKNKEQYYSYLERIEEIFQAPNGSPEADELGLLVLLVEKFENEQYIPIDLNPIDIIKVRMNELSLNQKDIVLAIGDKGNTSKIINGQRTPTILQVRKLATILKVPVDLLVGKPIEVLA